MIQTYDSLADECVQILNKIPTGEDKDKPFKKDLYGLLKKHADEDQKLKQLWDEVNTVPEWVDWEQIQRGQDVFFRYGVPILNVVSSTLLGLPSRLSLLTAFISLDLRVYLEECKHYLSSFIFHPPSTKNPEGAPCESWKRLPEPVVSALRWSDVDSSKRFNTFSKSTAQQMA